MDVFLIIVAIVGVIGIIAAAIGIWKNKDKKDKKFWASVGVGVMALVAIVLAVFGLGRKRKIDVKFVEGHEREVAPTGEEKGKLDEKSDRLDKDIEEAGKVGEKLEKEAKDLDARKEKLEKEADATDDRITDVGDGGSDSDDDSDFTPSADISDRLRES